MQNDKKLLIIGACYGLISTFIWGAFPVISKFALAHQMQPADVTALRFGIAGLCLLPVLIKYSESWRHMLPKALILIFCAGAPYVHLAVYGLSLAPATHFGLIVPSTMLLCSMVGGYLWLNEKWSRDHTIGLSMIVIGNLCIAGFALQSYSLTVFKGDLIYFTCGALWATYTLLCKYWRLPPLLITAWLSVVSMVLYLPVYFLFFDSGISEIPIRELLIQGIYQGVFTGIFAVFFFTKAVSLLGAGKGSLFAALVPSIALVLSFLLLSEEIRLLELLGVMIVSLGMLFALHFLQLRSSK